MASRDYRTLALPDALVRRIDAFVRDNDWGFRNRGEVAAAAVREFLQRYDGESGQPSKERAPKS